MSACVYCGRGFHLECRKCRKGKCHSGTDAVTTIGEVETESHDKNQEEPRKRKSAKENLSDPKSTGRKRAAILYPIDGNAPCEWRGKRNCGGGRRPIIGCLDGVQKHRHHGPVKDTTRNELGNVHRICTDCHVHWHELNDLIYVEREYNLLPHQPVPATDLEIVQNKLDWTSGKMGRMFELASSKNQEKHRNATQLDLPTYSPDEVEVGSDYSVLEPLDGEDS